MKKCYGYIRVSTSQQSYDGLSLDNQENEIRAYAEKENMKIIEIFADEGKSGRTIQKREGLKKVLEIMKKEDILIVYSLSRLARNTLDFGLLNKELEERKCSLVVIKEKIETVTAMGKFQTTIVAGSAQLESDLTSERVKECMKLKKERGEFLGRISYGWELSNGKGSDLIENIDEQKIIRKIKYMKRDREKVKNIIKYLDDNGIKPPHNSKQWYPNTIRRIVQREGVNTKGREKKLIEE